MAFVVVLLVKSLLQLIDFIGAPLVLRAVVFNQLIKTSITLCWRQMASTFSVFSPTYSPLRCVNRATMFTYRRFTPLCLGCNTSSISVVNLVLCWGSALACVDCGAFELVVGWAGLRSIHWQVLATRLHVQGVAQLSILLLEGICNVFSLGEFRAKSLYVLFQVDSLLDQILTFISKLLDLHEQISPLSSALVAAL